MTGAVACLGCIAVSLHQHLARPGHDYRSKRTVASLPRFLRPAVCLVHEGGVGRLQLYHPGR